MRLLRLPLFLLLHVAAFAGTGVQAWAPGQDQIPGATGSVAAGFDVDGGGDLALLEAPAESTAFRSQNGTAGSGVTAGRSGNSPPPRAASVSGAALASGASLRPRHSSAPSAPGIAHAAVLARAGSLSSFGTSLPPPHA